MTGTAPVPCPKCGDDFHRHRPIWMLWGGFIGPLLLRRHHRRCRACGTYFNAKTAKVSLAPGYAYAVAVAAMMLLVAVLVLFG